MMFVLFVLFFALMMFIRNACVFSFHSRLHNEWYARSKAHIANWDWSRPFQPEEHPLDKLPSYNEMMLRFWVWPVSRFAKRLER